MLIKNKIFLLKKVKLRHFGKNTGKTRHSGKITGFTAFDRLTKITVSVISVLPCAHIKGGDVSQGVRTKDHLTKDHRTKGH